MSKRKHGKCNHRGGVPGAVIFALNLLMRPPTKLLGGIIPQKCWVGLSSPKSKDAVQYRSPILSSNRTPDTVYGPRVCFLWPYMMDRHIR